MEKPADSYKLERKNTSEMSRIATKDLSNISNHFWSNNHLIDFDNSIVIDKGGYRIRKTLESWPYSHD